MDANKILSIGIIGAGGIADSVHLPGLSEMKNIKITALCDIYEDRLNQTAQKYKIPQTYRLYNDMIAKEELDAVFILVQPDQLYRITYDCLEHGLNVFMEKPAGITVFQTRSLMRKARQKDKIVQVGFNGRYIPLVQYVLDIMRNTTKITQVEGCFFKNGSASFYNGCASSFECDTIHSIDLVQWISGGIPIKAATVQSQENSEVPNAWNSVIKFDNGVTGIVKANYQTGGRVHTLEIHGPKASAYVNLGFGSAGCDAKFIYYNGKSSFSLSSQGTNNPKIQFISGTEVANSKDYYKYYGYYAEDLNFIECIRTYKQPLANIDEAVKSMELVEMLYKSII